MYMYTSYLLISNTSAFNAYSYNPITKASNENDLLALAVPGDILKDPIDKLMDDVSLMVGEGDMEERNDERREDVPLGGLKISLASSS